MTDSANAWTSSGPMSDMSIEIVQPASSTPVTPPVPTRVSITRSGVIGSYDSSERSAESSGAVIGSHVTVAMSAAVTEGTPPTSAITPPTTVAATRPTAAESFVNLIASS